jgi:membrane protein YqaA with SNARE-associated domain
MDSETSATQEQDKSPRPDSRADVFTWIRAALPLTLAILVSVGVIILITAFGDQIGKLKGYGYLGAFLIGFLANATVILPAPSMAFTAALGGVLNPVLVGIAAGTGEALGEMTGYLAGLSGNAVIEQRAFYESVQRYMERYGAWVFFVLAAIPNPLFDIVGIAAGMVRFPVVGFLLSVWAGKTFKAVFVASAGRRLL